jgi:hypothetical protein
MGTQVREILRILVDLERTGWESLKWVCSNFLGGKKSLDFSDATHTLPKVYKEMRFSRVTIALLFAFTLDIFPENLGEVSVEQGENFH